MDNFCKQYPMINIGEDKCHIVKDVLNQYQPLSILELGCYFGYSALFMALHSKAIVHTFDPDEKIVAIAK